MAQQTEKKMTRAEKSALTREKIIKAGYHLLKEKGYEAMTVRNICEDAQVSTGSFYHFYKSRDELLGEFLKVDEWAGEMDDPDDIIAYILFGYSKLLDSYDSLGVEFVTGYYTADNQAFNIYTREPGQYASDMIKTKLLHARTEGYIRDDLPIDKIIYDIQVIVIGNVFQWCVLKGASDVRMDLDRMLRDYLLLEVVTDKYREKYC